MENTKEVSDIIAVGIDEMIDNDLEGFLDLISDRVGHPLLMDIGYKAVAINDDGTIRLKVTGFIELEEDEE